ncbi:MAG: ATP-binding cassette domain-containing protein, partial [Lachnospiraceae bacterium]|nr:ATP-binding cassette domain-containing protein [Lachnospiraceae bacterium]
MAQIICVDLAIGYETGTVADNINFSIDKGEYLYILGENGSGKTTLMKTLLGLTKPLGGQILTHDGLTRSEIGYLPQHTDVQKDFPASVKEIVLSGFQGRMGMRPFYRRSEK